jgi:23S rRNA (uracil1939-C5)-methyltransferase
LVALVREFLDPGGGETLVDAYCGVGLFGLALADQVKRVIGVEVDPSAIADFQHNAQGMEHVAAIQGQTENAFSELEGPLDLMVIDPPRSGAGKGAVGEILRLQPQRVAYVSCDPATLARDARDLVGGGYHIHVVQPVDLFPQTYHIESVVLFDRANQ